jgi:hypothetical protein
MEHIIKKHKMILVNLTSEVKPYKIGEKYSLQFDEKK